jgi:hypothetical protein
MKKFISLFAAIIICAGLQSQEISSFTAEDLDKEKNYGYFNYIQFSLYRGQHMVDDKVKDYFSDGFNGIGLRFGTQSTGRKEWQRRHLYPQYGLGVSVFGLGGEVVDSLLGRPSSIYFYFGAPIWRFKTSRINADLEIGLATDFKPYNADTNPYQNYIGAKTNLHFNMTIAYYLAISQRMDLSLGVSMMHFSNGRTFTPQKGINLFGVNLSTAYNFNPVKNFTKATDPNYQPQIRPEFIKAEKAPFKGHHEFILMEALGTVQAEPGEWKNDVGTTDTTGIEGPRYMTNSFVAEYAYQFARKIKVVAGLDMFYDGSLENNYADIYPQDVTFNEKLFYGFHIGGHYLIERFTFLFNIGGYIYKPFPQRGSWFMRAGGRIGLTPHLDAHVCLKTRNGGVADWIEWGVAYKFFKDK